jgi:hypothetical protein
MRRRADIASGPATAKSMRFASVDAMTAKRTTTKKRSARPSDGQGRKWSQHVTETSDALDLEAGVFRKGSPRQIASSLKRSADRSRRRKAGSFRSAMSMLTFYVNRAGKHLSAARRRVLDAAKDELRAVYGRPTRPTRYETSRTRTRRAQRWPQPCFTTGSTQNRSSMVAAKKARKYGKQASAKVAKAMHERKQGTLRSGRSAKKVTSRKQAVAIGLSEARRSGAKVPKKKDGQGTKKGRRAKKSPSR